MLNLSSKDLIRGIRPENKMYKEHDLVPHTFEMAKDIINKVLAHEKEDEEEKKGDGEEKEEKKKVKEEPYTFRIFDLDEEL